MRSVPTARLTLTVAGVRGALTARLGRTTAAGSAGRGRKRRSVWRGVVKGVEYARN